MRTKDTILLGKHSIRTLKDVPFGEWELRLIIHNSRYSLTCIPINISCKLNGSRPLSFNFRQKQSQTLFNTEILKLEFEDDIPEELIPIIKELTIKEIIE